MNCDKYNQWITDRLAGELTQEQEKLLELHLKQCEKCRKYASEAEKMWQGVAQTFAEDGAKEEKMTQNRLDAIRSEFNSYLDTTNAGDTRVITFREQHKRRFIFHSIAACVVCVLIAIVVLSEKDEKSDSKKVTDSPKTVAPAAAPQAAPAAAPENVIASDETPTAVLEEAQMNNADTASSAPEPEKVFAARASKETGSGKRKAQTAEAVQRRTFAFALPDDMTAPEKQMFRRECGVVMSPFVPNTLVCCSIVIPGKRLKGEVKQDFVPVENFAVTPVQVSSGNALIFAYKPAAQPLQEKNKIRLTLPNGRKLPLPVTESEWVAYEQAPAYLQLACLIHALSVKDCRSAILRNVEMRKKVALAMKALQEKFAKDPARYPFEREYMLMFRTFLEEK